MDTTERDDLEGELSTVTDEEWRDAHHALAADVMDAAPSVQSVREDIAAGFGYWWDSAGRHVEVDQ